MLILSLFQLDPVSGLLEIIWEDGHVSPYSEQWLLDHSFREPVRKEHVRREVIEEVLWDSSDAKDMPKADFK